MTYISEIARRTLRRCFCEGSADIAKQDLQQCIDCGHTTCISCGGNPVHNYQYSQALSKGRVLPQTAEASPIQTSTAGEICIDCRPTRSASERYGETPIFTEYLKLVQKAVGGIFSLESIRRTHCITVTYQSSLQSGKLELVLNDHYAEWRVFVSSPLDLPSNHPLRRALQPPVAKSRPADSLFPQSWSWRNPLRSKVKVHIKGHGERLPSWWARSELPDFRDDSQPQFLTITYKEQDRIRPEAVYRGNLRVLASMRNCKRKPLQTG